MSYLISYSDETVQFYFIISILIVNSDIVLVLNDFAWSDFHFTLFCKLGLGEY